MIFVAFYASGAVLGFCGIQAGFHQDQPAWKVATLVLWAFQAAVFYFRIAKRS